MLSQQHLCQLLTKLVNVHWSYSVQHQCHFLRHNVHVLLFNSLFFRWTWVTWLSLGSSSTCLEENLWGFMEWVVIGHVLSASQPSVLKHWREHKVMTVTSGLALSFLHLQPGFWWKGHCCLYAFSLTPVQYHTHYTVRQWWVVGSLVYYLLYDFVVAVHAN